MNTQHRQLQFVILQETNTKHPQLQFVTLHIATHMNTQHPPPLSVSDTGRSRSPYTESCWQSGRRTGHQTRCPRVWSQRPHWMFGWQSPGHTAHYWAEIKGQLIISNRILSVGCWQAKQKWLRDFRNLTSGFPTPAPTPFFPPPLSLFLSGLQHCTIGKTWTC